MRPKERSYGTIASQPSSLVPTSWSVCGPWQGKVAQAGHADLPCDSEDRSGCDLDDCLLLSGQLLPGVLSTLLLFPLLPHTVPHPLSLSERLGLCSLCLVSLLFLQAAAGRQQQKQGHTYLETALCACAASTTLLCLAATHPLLHHVLLVLASVVVHSLDYVVEDAHDDS